jgi:hypothetical protein
VDFQPDVDRFYGGAMSKELPWVREQHNLQAKPNPGEPVSAFSYYGPGFLKPGGESEQDIADWRLIAVRPLPVQQTSRDQQLQLPGAYALSFVNKRGGSVFTWRFLPEDIIYFCEYDPNDRAVNARRMEVAPLTRQSLPSCARGAPKEFVQPSERATWMTVQDLVAFIIDNLLFAGRWRETTPGRRWEAVDGARNGLPVVEVEGFGQNLDVASPQKLGFFPADRKLVAVERVGTDNDRLEDVYRLEFVFYSSQWWRQNVSLTVWGEQSLRMAVCSLALS